eukprot:5234111-Ditylum_brightwellii.AAC.1
MGLILIATICMAQSAASKPKLRAEPQVLRVDSDSFVIGIDNQASVCISNNPDHFITELKPWPSRKKKSMVHDFRGGTTKIQEQATVQWRIEDDNGKVSVIDIPNLAYVPSASYCILSSQHWAQHAQDNYPNKYGTWCSTFEDNCILQWKQCSHTMTVKHDPKTNVPKFRSAPGTIHYRVTLAVLEASYGTEDLEHLCYDTHLAHDLDAKSHVEQDLDDLEDTWQYTHPTPLVTRSDQAQSTQLQTQELKKNITNFMENHPQLVHAIPEEEGNALAAINNQAKLLQCHHQLNHFSFEKLRLLSLLGILSIRLSTI